VKALLAWLAYASLLSWVHTTALQPNPAVPSAIQRGSSAAPFNLRAGFLIVVDGRIGTLQHLKFIVDTGASRTIVSQEIASRLGLAREPGTVIHFQNKLPVEWARFPEVQVGPIVAKNVPMMVGDLPRYSEFAHDIDAIIGLDLLGRCKSLQIDYVAGRVAFKTCAAPPDPALPASRGIFVTLMLEDQPIHLLLDTGFAGIAVFEKRLRAGLQELNVRDQTQPQYRPKDTVVKIGSLIGEEVRLPGLRIGPDSTTSPVLLIHGDLYAVPPGLDGYIGPRALQAKRLDLDFARGRLRWQ
jgi:predicted aspartyl protease